MRTFFTTFLGKLVRFAARLRGGGSALPGLVVERLDGGYVPRVLGQLERGVVVVSGTNGKTTTTKIVVELLEGQGLRVFTNRTGSNFVRGVAASLIAEVNAFGRLKANIAVLELDEAHGVHFVNLVKPEHTLLLNVMRDQLDRFGEIDTTAKLLQKIAQATQQTVVLNRDDPRLGAAEFINSIDAAVTTYGVHPDLLTEFPSDDEMYGGVTAQRANLRHDDCSLEAVENYSATITFGDTTRHVDLSLNGIYNVLNAVGAVAVVRQIVGDDLNEDRLFESLAAVTPAFGRGESFDVDGKPLELVLVKNPSGFRLGLRSFDAADYATMIAINDDYADGQDMSWLWDVGFEGLRGGGVAVVSGVRAYDMALRLHYDQVPVAQVDTDLKDALDHFIATHRGDAKRIFCTYTAMLALRRHLSKVTEVKAALS